MMKFSSILHMSVDMVMIPLPSIQFLFGLSLQCYSGLTSDIWDRESHVNSAFGL